MGLVQRKAAGRGVLCAFVEPVIAELGGTIGRHRAASAHFREGVIGERARAMVTILTGPAADAAGIEPLVAANWAATALAQRPASERAKALAGVRLDLGSAELAKSSVAARTTSPWSFARPRKGSG